MRSDKDAEGIAEKLISVVSRPFTTNGKTAIIGYTIGGVLYPDSADKPETLLQGADAAMYDVKKAKQK